MRKLFTLLSVAMLGFTVLNAQTPVKKDGQATPTEPAKFETVEHDFGKIVMGPNAEFTFVFKNNGSVDIAITSANASCGCTTPKWTNTPVKAGEKGEVKASYATQGRLGSFNKQITVTFDNGQTVVLKISGEVITAPEPSGNGTPMK